ncbi:hypothetical protein SRHO_G00090300 [Serrasalmus rhombeus]
MSGMKVHMNFEVVLAVLEDGTSGASSGKMFVWESLSIKGRRRHRAGTWRVLWNSAGSRCTTPKGAGIDFCTDSSMKWKRMEEAVQRRAEKWKAMERQREW